MRTFLHVQLKWRLNAALNQLNSTRQLNSLSLSLSPLKLLDFWRIQQITRHSNSQQRLQRQLKPANFYASESKSRLYIRLAAAIRFVFAKIDAWWSFWPLFSAQSSDSNGSEFGLI